MQPVLVLPYPLPPKCWEWSNLLSTMFSSYSLTSRKLGFTSFKASLGVCFLVFWLTNIDPGEEVPGKLQAVLQGDSSTCQLLEAVLLADSILLHISQDLAGITNFLMEVLQQLLGHFCSLAWQECGVE